MQYSIDAYQIKFASFLLISGMPRHTKLRNMTHIEGTRDSPSTNELHPDNLLALTCLSCTYLFLTVNSLKDLLLDIRD